MKDWKWHKRLIDSSNIYTTVKDIVSKNGYGGLWRGTVPTIMR
jgi:solute carrier family 25 protein 38